MNVKGMTLERAFAEVSASSAGGAPFLLAYGFTFLITGILSYILPETTVALMAMFQGIVALPLAFFLERRLGWERMAADNPLRSLSAQLAVSQALIIPALIVVFNLNPRAIPVVLAGIGGMHFLPYAWLHRTRLYAYLATAVALGAFALQIFLGSAAFNIILLYVGVVYLVLAMPVYQQAIRLAGQAVPASSD
jgi:hypothetical protein